MSHSCFRWNRKGWALPSGGLLHLFWSAVSRPKVWAIVDGGKAKRRPRSQTPPKPCLRPARALQTRRFGSQRRVFPGPVGTHFAWVALAQGERRCGAWDRGRRFALPPSTMVKTFGLEATVRRKPNTPVEHSTENSEQPKMLPVGFLGGPKGGIKAGVINSSKASSR